MTLQDLLRLLQEVLPNVTTGVNWGWDGYVRRAEPNLVSIIWPS